ncbi:MAG: hypothetical protein WC642_15240, partial [Nocardioides sp.]
MQGHETPRKQSGNDCGRDTDHLIMLCETTNRRTLLLGEVRAIHREEAVRVKRKHSLVVVGLLGAALALTGCGS